MQELNKNRAGLIFGSFLGLWHLAWSLLVAANLAQTLLDWIYTLHFLNNPFRVAAFDFATAALLVSVTAVVGYIFGWVLALLWNAFHRHAGLEHKPALEQDIKPA